MASESGEGVALLAVGVAAWTIPDKAAARATPSNSGNSFVGIAPSLAVVPILEIGNR